MRKALVVFGLLAATHCKAQVAVPSAKAVLKKASIEAVASHKKILLIFHASWCGWCRKMDSAISNTMCKSIFEQYYVITHLTVLENRQKKANENPGAEAQMKSYKAFEAGLPFWVILDEKGQLLEDSYMGSNNEGPANIGCPASEKEVKAFTQKLAATAALTSAELDIITEVFRKNEL